MSSTRIHIISVDARHLGASGRVQHGWVIVVSTHYITTVKVVLFVVLSLVCRCASMNDNCQ